MEVTSWSCSSLLLSSLLTVPSPLLIFADGLAHVADGGAQLVVQRVVLQELAGGSLARVEAVDQSVDLPDGSADVLIQRVFVDQAPDGAVGRVQGRGQLFHVVHDLDGTVVERLVHQERSDGALAAFDVVDDAVDPVHDFLQGGQRGGTLLEQILDLGSIGAGDFRAGLDGLRAACPS